MQSCTGCATWCAAAWLRCRLCTRGWGFIRCLLFLPLLAGGMAHHCTHTTSWQGLIWCRVWGGGVQVCPASTLACRTTAARLWCRPGSLSVLLLLIFLRHVGTVWQSWHSSGTTALHVAARWHTAQMAHTKPARPELIAALARRPMTLHGPPRSGLLPPRRGWPASSLWPPPLHTPTLLRQGSGRQGMGVGRGGLCRRRMRTLASTQGFGLAPSVPGTEPKEVQRVRARR